MGASTLKKSSHKHTKATIIFKGLEILKNL